jgi:hypothetical protein
MKGSPHRVLVEPTSHEPRVKQLGLQRAHELSPAIRLEEVCPDKRNEKRGKGTRHEPGRIGILRSLTKSATGREEAVMGTILLIVLVLFFVGALPTWPHSHNWGYVPSGGLGVVVLVLLVLVLTGRL